MSALAQEELYPPEEISDGLILRRSTPADTDHLVDFNRRIHFFVPEHEVTIPAMTRDLMSGCLPGFRPGDFTLVVEQATGRIVSAMALIPQTWRYGDATFKVGRPELVGTDPQFRGKGLVREQFRWLHALSRQRGQLVQAITGIPFFYRQFGYELGAPSGGGWTGNAQPSPLGSNGGDPRLRIRPAREGDLHWIRECYQAGSVRYLLTTLRDAGLWRYELCDKADANIHKVEVNAIVTTEDCPAGFFVCPKGFGPVEEKVAIWYDLLPGFSWHQVTPVVLGWLWDEGQKEAQEKGGVCARIGLMLGEEHPAYPVTAPWLPTRVEPGAWYVRVADPAGFVRRIAPVLRRRLAASAWSGFSGELRLSSYKVAYRLTFAEGRLEGVEPYRPADWDDADVAFPNLTFLQLLFGFRSLQDLRYAYPDCWARAEKVGLVEALFPKLPSNIWGLA